MGYNNSMDTDAWLAGLFEGEGCFFINDVKKVENGRHYKYPAASLKMTDEDVVRRFHKAVGFGSVSFVKKRLAHWKNGWSWRCNGFSEVEALFKRLAPYLGARRLQTAREVLATPKVPPREIQGHGTSARYKSGCRCKSCKKAQREYQAAWRRA